MKKDKPDVVEPGVKAINDKTIGAIGESAAQMRLKKEGYKIVARNVFLPNGELDIVATEANCIAFIEVKTRLKLDVYRPSDNVTYTKAEKIRRLSAIWLRRNKRYANLQVRFDVVEVILDEATLDATEIIVNKRFF